MFGGSGVIHQASTNCGIRRSSIEEHGEGLENMENLETWKTSTRCRLGICQKIYTTQFSGERILHTENA